MLSEDYFNGNRLKAYLALLKEYEAGTLDEIREEVQDVPTVIVGCEVKDNEVDPAPEEVVKCLEISERDVNGRKNKDVDLVLISPQQQKEDVGVIEHAPQRIFAEVVDTVASVNMRVLPDSKCFRVCIPGCRTVKIRNGQWSKEVNTYCVNFLINYLRPGYPRERIRGMMNEYARVCETDFLVSNVSEEERVRVTKQIGAHFSGTVTKFPGTEFAGVKRKDLLNFQRYKYLCAPKIDGVRYIFSVLSKKGYFLGRDRVLFKMHREIDCPDLVVDGELCFGQYFVFDVVRVDKENVARFSFSKRMTFIDGIIKSLARAGEEMFASQKFYPMAAAETALKSSVEGLVFIPKELPYVVGYSTTMFKFKEGYDTLDLLVCKGDQVGKLEYRSVRYFKKKEETIFFSPVVDHGMHDKIGKIVECRYMDGHWRYVRTRDDKKLPNAEWVCREVLGETKNPITLKEIMIFALNS